MLPAKKKYIVTSWESVQFETNQKNQKPWATDRIFPCFQDNIQNFAISEVRKKDDNLKPILSK